MAQDLTSRIPELIQVGMVPYLATRPALLGKVKTFKVPEARLAGGKTIKVHKKADIFTPTNVDHSTDNYPTNRQEIATGSVDLTMNVHKETIISIDELEDIYSQGGKEAILEDTIPGVVNGLIREFDKALTALYSSFSLTAGAYNAAITDANLRIAMEKLANAGVDMDTPGSVHFITSSKGYFIDLLGIDRYVTPLNVGTVQNPSAIISGFIPTLFNTTVGWSHHIQKTTVSGNTVAHSLLFEKNAFGIGFTEFAPANAPNVKETIITDPKTRVSIRQQVYYDPKQRRWVAQWDVMGGVCVIDANRFVRYQHQEA